MDYERSVRMNQVAPSEITIVSIMKKYGWTYTEYLDEPEWVIDAILAKEMVESRLKNEAQNKNSR